MVNFLKNTWWLFLIILAGGIVFFLSFVSSKPQGDQGVVLEDIFHSRSQTVPLKKADPVPSMAIVTSPMNGHEEGFTIQVYSFLDKNRAQTALQSLKTGGYQAFLIVSDLGPRGLWYRVRVGPIGDGVKAHQMLASIRKSFNSGIIVKPNN
ncbi:MAG: SPOR domain-containing protein [Candidatus Omnitrophica bacterium]|nr:SPOR domain-containing protein [Candidatus Omnitrophota bacterium]